MCRLQDHDHKWSQCPNNPRSKNYSGTHYTSIWEAERNKTLANENDAETSTSKKHHSNNQDKKRGEVQAIQSTPMVKFTGDFDYSSDDEDSYVSGRQPTGKTM